MKNLFFILSILIISIGTVIGQNCNPNLQINVAKNDGSLVSTQVSKFEVCEGVPVKFFLDSSMTQQGYTFQWRKRKGTDYQTINEKKTTSIILSKATESGYYSCLISKNGCGSWVSDEKLYSAQTTVFVSLRTTRNKNDDGTYSLCASGGDDISMVADVKQYPSGFGESYSWFKDGKEIPYTNQNYYRAYDAGNYSVQYKQGNCTANTETSQIVKSNQMKSVINTDAFLTEDLRGFKDSISICTGMTARFGLTETYPNANWTRNGVSYNNINIYGGIDIIESGNYQATYKRGACDVSTNKVYVNVGNVVEFIPMTFYKSNNYESCFGRGNVQFSGRMYNVYPSSKDPGTPIQISGKTQNIQTVPASFPYFTGFTNKSDDYYINYENGSCKAKTLTYKILPSDLAFGTKITKSEIKSNCGNGSTFLEIDNDFQNNAFQWFKDGVAIEGAIDTRLATNKNGKYWLQLKSGSCIGYSDTVVVNLPQNNTSIPTISIDNSKCKEGIYTLTTPIQTGYSYLWRKDGQILNGENQSILEAQLSGKYTVSIFDGKCSTESESLELGNGNIIVPKLCENLSFQLSFSGKAKSYEWDSPNGFKSGEAFAKIIKSDYNSFGLYRLKTTQENGCVSIATTTLQNFTVYDPNIQLTSNPIVPLGGLISIQTNLNNSLNGKWYAPFGNTIYYNLSFLSLTNVTESMSGDYAFEINNNGCFYKKTVNIQVVKSADYPKIVLQEIPAKTYCVGEEVKINFITSGKFPLDTKFVLRYYSTNGQYDDYNTNLKEGNNTIIIPKYYVTNSFRFQIAAINNGLQATSNLTNSNVLKQPFSLYFSTTELLNSALVCKGLSITFIADTTSQKLNYQWLLNDKEIKNATQRKLIATDSGRYALKYTMDGCTTVSSTGWYLNFGKSITPPNYRSNNSITQVCEGFSIPLSIIDPGAKYQVQWKKDGLDIANATSLDYRASQTGNYAAEITSEGGCKASTKPVTVIVGSPMTALANPDDKYETCRSVLLYFNNSVNLDLLKAYDYRFQWTKDNQDIKNANDITYTATESGNFQLRVEQGKCIAYSKIVNVKKTDKLNFLIDPTNAITKVSCNKSNVIIYTYPTKSYTDNNFSSSIWYKDGAVFASSSAISINQSGKYNIVYSSQDGFCKAYSDTISMNFEINKSTLLENLLYSNSQAIGCKTDSVQLSIYNYYPVTQNIWKYQWIKDGKPFVITNTPNIKVNESGAYSVEFSYLNGCKGITKPLEIKKGAFIISISEPLSSDVQICNSSQIRLSGSSNYYGAFENLYQWQKDGKDLLGATNFNNYSTGSGIYTLKVKSGDCSGVSIPIKITETAPIDATITPKDSIVICPTQKIDLKVPTDAGIVYSWRRNEVLITNTNISTLSVSEQAIYKAILQRGNCVKASNPVQVFVKNIAPTATLSGDKQLTYGDSTAIKIDFTSSPPWTFKFADDTNKVLTASTSPYLRYVKPLESKIYTVASIKNLCGVGKSSGTAKITVLILGTEEVTDGVKINLFPMPANTILQLEVETPEANTLQWQLTDIQGRTLKVSEKESKQTRHEQQISVADLPSGVYLFKAVVGEKIVYRKVLKE